MTRKRFVKLLMSKGCSRNQAVEIAAYYNYNNVPYKTAYLMESPRVVTYAAVKLSEAFASMCRPLNNIADSFANAMKDAFNELAGDSDV